MIAAPARAAEPADAAAAEALFASGKALLQRGDYDQACPKLEESYRLDPATGALLALALCHEGQGKLASAWAELLNVAALASAEHNSEREQAARQRAESLAPRLAFLSFRVDAALAKVPGLIIRQDGVLLGPAAWGSRIPVDPGEHWLRVSAPGRKPWAKQVSIVRSAEQAVVDIPDLPPEARSEPSKAPAPELEVVTAPVRPLRVAGIALISAGGTSLLLSGGALWRALSQDSAATANCTPSPCNPSGERQRSSALEAGKFATAASIVGGALLGTGIVLFVMGKPEPSRARQARWATGLTPRGFLLLREF